MKRFKQLDRRLTAIAELVREGASVCDVGTDHAYLPCYLARSGRYGQIYACDLNPKPLEFARAQIAHQNAEVTLLQSDGLANLPPCDDVVIAGMGGELIAEIVAKMPQEFKTANLRLILQPMTRAGHLRAGLAESGFDIISEQTVRENNRDFIIIYARLAGADGNLPEDLRYGRDDCHRPLRHKHKCTL
jgi:tRNA (adenine22-N1)-methyltransferase